MPVMDDVDALLKARAEIDEQLRRHKNALTVLFTDVVGSTSFFERNGDTAGLVMIHRHDEVAARAIQRYKGKVVKTIGDSAMAEFPNPASAVRAAVEIERQFLKLNMTLPEDQRVQVRIGVHTGVGFRKGKDLFGDVVNVTSRIVKRTAPAQILISRAMHEAVSHESDLQCRWLSTLTIDGRTEKEDIYEVVWTDAETYRGVQDRLAAASHIPPRYQVLSQIGSGGTGILYKVRDLETGEIVALKVLKPEIASDPDVQENFKRELCLARKITHKNVCRIHEFSRSNGTTYTSMEYVEGESLASRLNRVGSLPLQEALEIGRQICAGLREAHLQGIVHRDLKPANIMLDRNGCVKIMDFGIARSVERDGPLTATIVGTAAYMAPEQAELKPVSAGTDIYALGLLLYEMITGVAAFHGDTPVVVALKQIREYPKRPREIVLQLSGAVESVIMKCLQKDPARRFRSTDELEIALVKAGKARPLSPWEAAINRRLAHAEHEIRNRLRQGVESAKAFLKRQDWQRLLRSQEEHKVILGAAGLVGVLAVSLLLWGWKQRKSVAHPVQVAGQNSPSAAAAGNGSNSEFTSLPAQNFMQPIASHDVDLYENAKLDAGKAPSVDPSLTNLDLSIDPPNPRSVSPKPARLVKPVKSPLAQGQQKPHAGAQTATLLPASATPSQPETLTSAGARDATMQPPEIDFSLADNLSEPVVEQSTATSQSKDGGEESTAPGFYLEVGIFKDETWANNAVDKLTELGFHAVLIHKNLLWAQSYHVEVGPYTNQKDIVDARQSLASQGFKAHSVN
ncbi:MAG TPA: protein kinase [Candidatus Acidoferrum sp.]|nr:protein kinase [Candidatus Acidoferrum sp.]